MNSVYNLKQLVAISKDDAGSDPLALKYAGWNKLTKEDALLLTQIGILNSDHSNLETSDVNYWSPQAPITQKGYPYNGCKIYRHNDFGTHYLIYTEHGGHVPETRCRFFDISLVPVDER